MLTLHLSKLAAIQYAGEAGYTQECVDAIVRLIQSNVLIVSARILTAQHEHGLLLTVDSGDRIAVKSGFGSGYIGEGSRMFSYVLMLLDSHGIEIEEVDVDGDLIARLDASALTIKDLKAIENSHPIRPMRWSDYIFDVHENLEESGRLWDEFKPVIPFSVIDRRLADVAKDFWSAPDERLMTAFRRLEDIVRKRASSSEYGSKLFSQAFNPTSGSLGWPRLDPAEQAGRMNLFVGAYLAYRNPRAHCEPVNDQDAALTEFLLVNHLYRLEGEAKDSPAVNT